jgi:hypothetical protein
MIGRSFIPLLLGLVLLGCSSAYWASQLDQATLQDSWATYQTFYAKQNSRDITYQDFLTRVQKGWLQSYSSQDFIKLGVENHRLQAYQHAKTAEEAYPLTDRPRRNKDLQSVHYFLNPRHPVSPITVAIMTDYSGKTRRIKLDGVHRMIAAHILHQPLQIFWIDLR